MTAIACTVAVVAGIIALCRMSLRYAARVEGLTPELDGPEGQCPELHDVQRFSGANKPITCKDRCELRRDHLGPHVITLNNGASDYKHWWNTKTTEKETVE